jgi:hypothetical protein
MVGFSEVYTRDSVSKWSDGFGNRTAAEKWRIRVQSSPHYPSDRINSVFSVKYAVLFVFHLAEVSRFWWFVLQCITSMFPDNNNNSRILSAQKWRFLECFRDHCEFENRPICGSAPSQKAAPGSQRDRWNWRSKIAFSALIKLNIMYQTK